MRGQLIRQITLCIILIVSITLLWYGIHTGTMIGADWYGKDANFQWHMNNYIVMDAQYAYSIFGLATLAIGGLATGLSMAAFFTVTKTTKHIIALVVAFFVAIAMTGLGFNTLDFMLGSFYWTNMQYPPPVQVPIFGTVDVWNFYFYLFVVPLWAGGFLMGSAASYYTLIYRAQHAAAAYIAKKNLADMINQTNANHYLAESKALWRSRKLVEQTFNKTN
jgi:hypothetical protein